MTGYVVNSVEKELRNNVSGAKADAAAHSQAVTEGSATVEATGAAGKGSGDRKSVV